MLYLSIAVSFCQGKNNKEPGLRLPASASALGAGLASCWPRPQQLLPVSAAGGGRRRCVSPTKRKAPLEIPAPRGFFLFGVSGHDPLAFSILVYAIYRRSQAPHRKFTTHLGILDLPRMLLPPLDVVVQYHHRPDRRGRNSAPDGGCHHQQCDHYEIRIRSWFSALWAVGQLQKITRQLAGDLRLWGKGTGQVFFTCRMMAM